MGDKKIRQDNRGVRACLGRQEPAGGYQWEKRKTYVTCKTFNNKEVKN